MAKGTKSRRVSKKRGGNWWDKITNEFTNPTSDLRKAFYQDGPIRTAGLDALKTVAGVANQAASAVPFLAPVAGVANTISSAASNADQAARQAGFGKMRRVSVPVRLFTKLSKPKGRIVAGSGRPLKYIQVPMIALTRSTRNPKIRAKRTHDKVRSDKGTKRPKKPTRMKTRSQK